MASIERKVAGWSEQGIITEAQARRIIEEESRTQKNWVGYGIASIGIVILLTGIISMVAANWEGIGATQKLGSYLLIQCLLGALVVHQDRTDGLPREVSLGLFALFFLPGMGLVSQIYNVYGELHGAAFFWCILALPATVLARSRLLPHLWTIACIMGTGSWLASAFSPARYPASTPFWIACAIAFSFCALGLLRSPNVSKYLASSFRIWSFSFFALAVCIGTFAYSVETSDRKPDFKAFVSMWMAIGSGVAVVHLTKPNYPRALALALSALLISLGAYFTVPALFVFTATDLSAFILFEMVWIFAAAAAGLAHRRRLFDLATIIITLRCIVAYFQVFGSLAQTGFGLVITGALMLGAAYLWNRARKPLGVWLERSA